MDLQREKVLILEPYPSLSAQTLNSVHSPTRPLTQSNPHFQALQRQTDFKVAQNTVSHLCVISVVFARHWNLICPLWLTAGRDVWLNLSPLISLKDTLLPLGSSSCPVSFCIFIFFSLSWLFLPPSTCMSPGAITSTGTFLTHPGDLNIERSHQASLVLTMLGFVSQALHAL